MNWSLGEAQSLAVKAARGAGLPWGLAEEAGLALRWLESQGLPGAAALALYLQNAEPPDAAHVRALMDEGKAAGPLCPIQLGAAFLDFGPEAVPSDLGQLRQPLLLTPFLAKCCEGALEWDDVRLTITDRGVHSSGDGVLDEQADCRFFPAMSSHRQNAGDALANPVTRVPDSAAPHMAILATLAARTYAPATEASRTGAGAGVTDND